MSDEYRDKYGLGVDEDANPPIGEGQAGQSARTTVYGDDQEEKQCAQTLVSEDDDDDEEEEPAKDQQVFTKQSAQTMVCENEDDDNDEPDKSEAPAAAVTRGMETLANDDEESEEEAGEEQQASTQAAQQTLVDEDENEEHDTGDENATQNETTVKGDATSQAPLAGGRGAAVKSPTQSQSSKKVFFPRRGGLWSNR